MIQKHRSLSIGVIFQVFIFINRIKRVIVKSNVLFHIRFV